MVVAAQLAFLAPRTALAHEGAHHGAHAHPGRNVTADAGFTTPCPGGSGHSCGCGNLDVLADDDGTPCIAVCFSRPCAGIKTNRTKRTYSESFFPVACALAHAQPRAPPSAV